MASSTRAHSGAIRTLFATEWKAARGYVEEEFAARVAWPGVPFTPPDAEWVRFNILWGDGFVQTMGGPGLGTNELVGVVSIQLFVKPGSGSGALEGYCDDVREIFNRVEVSGVRFEAPSGPRPPQERDGWLQGTVDVAFTVEETL